MKYNYLRYRLIFVMSMIAMTTLQANAQGDALIGVVTHATIQDQCEDGAIDLTVNGGYAPYDYHWEYSIDGGTSYYAGNTQDISNLRGGFSYCVTVTDDYCGSVAQCWDVNCCFDIMISSDVTHATNSGDCEDGAIDISVSGGGPGYSYMWSYDDGSGPRSFGSTEGNISQLRNYTYCVTVTDQNCGATSSSCMGVLCCPDVPEETITNICKVNELGAIRLDVSGGYNYYINWYDSNGNFLAGSDSGIDQLQAGTYTAIFTTLGNNCTFTRSYEVISNVISVQLVDIENPSCYGADDDGMITISVDTEGNIPYTVNWYESLGGYPYGGTIGTGTMLSNIEEGEYIAVITTEFCTIEAGSYRLICCIKDDENGEPQSTLPFPAFVDVVTNWESSDGACDGSISYGTNIPNHVQKKITIKKIPENIELTNTNNLCSGTYCITIDNFCDEYTECFEVGSCSNVSINITGEVTNTCQSVSYGKINLSVSGGSGPYKYKWSNGKTTAQVANLPQGTFCVTVTDVHGCIASSCFVIGLNSLVTRRKDCLFTTTCNNEYVRSNDIGNYSVVRQSDCRYKDYYCNDGVYLRSIFVGTYIEQSAQCTRVERCRQTGEIYKVHRGVFETVMLGPDIYQPWCFLCHTATRCRYPTLGNDIQYLSFSNGGAISYTPNQGCTNGQQYIKLYCGFGNLIWEGCLDPIDLCQFRAQDGGGGGQKGNFIVLDTIQMDSVISHVPIENFYRDLGSSEFIKLVEENSLKSESIEIKIQPNPVFDKLNISFSENIIQGYQILVYNTTGQLQNLPNATYYNSNKMELDVLNLSSGPYHLVIKRNSIIIHSQTFIKL